MQHDEIVRTYAHGETALKYLKANETPAFPRNYELWYTYSSGLNRELNQAINEALRAHGSLSPSMTDKIYEEFVSPAVLTERVGKVSGELTGEVAEIIKALARAGGSVGTYGDALKTVMDDLDEVDSTAKLQPILSSIIDATREMETQNSQLEKRLQESQSHISELQQTLESIRFESLTDQLTGLANRKRFDEALLTALNAAEETGNAMCLILGDVDHFKKFNDTFGHQTGDQVLRLVAATLRNNVKGQDTAARYGGEEFGIVLPRTDLESAFSLADQIREVIKAKELIKRSTGESLGRVTMSFGVAVYHPNDTAETIIERADAALYAAKRTGRDRVMRESGHAEESAVA
ncbi:MAG: GGDEF domain-containing protein [Rhodobiaceae bacterium]|nr:GGDEF domain-containing protein [Rhodobiaceae bacterium]MCC0056957.1 GGDEF domain-containing protein [Rhodobiaceae bacterium]